MAKILEIEGNVGGGPGQIETQTPSVPTAAGPAAVAIPDKPAAKRGSPIRKLLLLTVAAAILGGAGYYGYDWWNNGRFIVSTDDAYVAADTATITPKIGGIIKSVPAGDNIRVRAGDPLVVLDDSDYRIALAQADAQIATQEASIARIEKQIDAGHAAVASARAQLASAQAASLNARGDFDRMNALEAKSVVAAKSLDAARTAMVQADAGVTAGEAAVAAAEANVAVAGAQKEEAARVLDQFRLAREQAQLNLDHTVIRAPFDGVVGNGAAEPGEFVQPGQRLIALVPLDDVYVDANFKETQLAELKPGQTVSITVDAYPDRAIEGTVESVSPASGSVFSLLPPENATGNFTKIVQRVPVRIRLPASVTSEGFIRPGMSIVAEVDTRTGPSHIAGR